MPDSVERVNAALEGCYRIERELGGGGMATLSLARDAKHKRQVATKVLRLGAVGRRRALPVHESGQLHGHFFGNPPGCK